MSNILSEFPRGKKLFVCEYVGIHEEKEVNNLFSFKIRKIFTQ